MRKAEFEQKYLGEKVQIELFDGDILNRIPTKNWS